MDVERIAARLFEQARSAGQSSLPVDADTPVAAVRSHVRILARAEGVRIRTGMVGANVLAVVRADAALWSDSTATMREKLATPLHADGLREKP